MGQATEIEVKYNCTPPTKIDADVLCLFGNSMISGYSGTISSLYDSVKNDYVPTGDQTWFKRYNGRGLLYSSTEKGYWLDYNISKSHIDGFFMLDSSFGKVVSTQYTWPNSLFEFVYVVDGSSIINGEEATTWHPSDDSSYWNDMILKLHEAIDYLISQGYNPRLMVMCGFSGIVSAVVADYEASMNAMIASLRAEFSDNSIYFYWLKCSTVYGDASLAYRDAVDLVVAADNKVFANDALDFPLTSGHFLNYSEIMRGPDAAAFFYQKLYGGTRPTCTNPSITGNLKVGAPIGFTYSYSGATENKTVKTDIRRLDLGYGTRCELWVAADDIGTDGIYYTALNYGETVAVNGAHVGKYLQARVWVVAQSGALHGYCVKGSWQGPVIA